MMTDNRSNQVEPEGVAQKKDYLKAGDIVQILPLDEIMKILDEKHQTQGLMFMPAMQKFCGSQRKVLKRVQYIFDEHAQKMRKISNVVILEDVRCNGEDIRFEAGCDRCCFFFWKETWLKKI